MLGFGKKHIEGEMNFLDHLEILRWHIIRSIIVIFVLTIVAFVFKGFIFDNILLAPKNPDFFTNKLFCLFATKYNLPGLCINQTKLQIININLTGQFNLHVTAAIVAGAIVAFPYVLWELWSFIKPALHEKEQKAARGGIFVITALFFTGVLFGYYIITPLSLDFLTTYFVSSEVQNQILISSFITNIISICLAGGTVFELPVFIYFLSKIGIVSSQFLKKYRKHAIVVNLIFAAIITPPDVFSQTLVFLPLFVLYEVGIIIAKRVEKKREAALNQ